MTLKVRGWLIMVPGLVWMAFELIIRLDGVGKKGSDGSLEMFFAAAALAHLDFYRRTSAIRQVRVWLIMLIPLAVLALTLLFRIMNWPVASVFLYGSIISMMVIYAVHFSQKRGKRLQDYMRLAVVLVGGLNLGGGYFYFLDPVPLNFILMLLLTGTTAEYLLNAANQRAREIAELRTNPNKVDDEVISDAEAKRSGHRKSDESEDFNQDPELFN